MTAEELKSKIGFEFVPDDFGSLTIVGGLKLSHAVKISKRWKLNSDAIENVKNEIREAIAREVYEDQRKEMYEALDEFMQCQMTLEGSQKSEAALERLLGAARYQPPPSLTRGGIMRVLVACEFSGVVREAFRRRGHDAWSCDLLEAEDGSEFHIQDDVFNHLDEGLDMLIFHWPCTHMLLSGVRWFTTIPRKKKPGILYGAERHAAMVRDADCFKKLLECDIPKI